MTATKLDVQLENLLGKTIRSVVVTKSIAGSEIQRIELIFDDSTNYELWSESLICGATNLSIGDLSSVLQRIESDPGVEIVACLGGNDGILSTEPASRL